MRVAILVPLALLAACGAKTDAGGASADEQRQLNEAAAALDVNAAATDTAADDTDPDQENTQ